jgi:tubulin gamma
MLANHTSIRHLFSKCVSSYKTLRKKQAFIDNYRKFPMFAVGPLQFPSIFSFISVKYFLFCFCISCLWFFFIQDNDLSEFDESREIIESLVDEYKACESPDYIKWGMEVIF